jgi:hypothetical protein
VLVRLVTAERTPAVVPFDELRAAVARGGDAPALIARLADAGLIAIAVGPAGAGTTAELASPALITGWPTLRRWLDEDRDDAALAERLSRVARRWQIRRHDPALLWRGDAASEARAFRTRYRGPLSPAERGFLDAVVLRDTAPARRRRTALAGGFSGLTAIAVAMAVLLVSIQRERDASRDREERATTARRDAERQIDRLRLEHATQEATEARALLARQAEATPMLRGLGDAIAKGESIAFAKDGAAGNLDIERELAMARAKEAILAMRLAQDAALRATEQARKAQAAQREAEDRNRELQRLIEREHRRVVDLERALGCKVLYELPSKER